MEFCVEVEKSVIDTIQERISDSFDIRQIGGMGELAVQGEVEMVMLQWIFMADEQSQEGRENALQCLQLPTREANVEFVIPSADHQSGATYGRTEDGTFFVSFTTTFEELKKPDTPIGIMFEIMKTTFQRLAEEGRISDFRVLQGDPGKWWEQSRKYH